MADDPFRPLAGGQSAGPAKSGAGAEWQTLSPAPKNAPPAPAEHPKRGAPSGVYTYRDARGDLLGHVQRFDLADGGKEFLPLTYCRSLKGELAWRWQSWPAPRPLYNLDRLAKKPKAPVVVVEGEKAADAAGEMFPEHVIVTSSHGSQSAAKADWSPLARRDVTVWADADDAGRKYAGAVVRLLLPFAGSIKLLEPPAGVKSGWDAADALAEGWDQARTAAFLATATSAIRGRRRRGESTAGGDDDTEATPGDGGEGDGAEPGRRRHQADQLLDLITDEIELWHSPDNDAYATVPVNGHFENWPVRSKGFRIWLIGQYFRRTGRGAGKQAIEEALSTIEARAITIGAEYTPCLRIAAHGEDVYLDLCDSQWRAVRINGVAGWSVVDRAPGKFVRTPAMAPLPEPEVGGSVDELRAFTQLDDGAFMLMVAWLMQSFNPAGPYPVLALYGNEGSGKTSLARLLRSMIDPSLAPDSGPPRDEGGLCLGAKNAWVLAIDNLSRMGEWLSDAMCRISTGGGIRHRVLYTNDEEVIYFLKRPQVITAIPEAAQRGDLLSRSICLTLPTLPKHARRTERELETDADRVRPLVLGALLSGVASALRHRDEVPPVQLPRMADFVTWIWRACPGLGWDDPQKFLDAYEANQAVNAEIAFEADGLAAAVVELMAQRAPGDDKYRRWSGTSTTLLADLPVDEKERKAKWWPPPNQVRNRLRRLQKTLAAKGIILDLDIPGHDKGRLMSITQPEPEHRGDSV